MKITELQARAKSVIKINGKSGELCDLTIPKGVDIISALNRFLPLIGFDHSVVISEKKDQWLSVSEPMTLSNNDKVWALWDDGEVEIATYIDWSCCFQRKCGTDEGQHGWNGSVGQVTHYIPLTAPQAPKELSK